MFIRFNQCTDMGQVNGLRWMVRIKDISCIYNGGRWENNGRANAQFVPAPGVTNIICKDGNQYYVQYDFDELAEQLNNQVETEDMD